MEIRNKAVFVGLSGGVDSAVSAALLKAAGARVTGVFIKGWYPPGMPCTWAAERRDAMRVAAHLRIPFRTLDASAEYKKEVIEYLLGEYRAGRTPNPDVMCNKEIKFGAFYRYALAQGADYIATGHYRSGEKDQSYFLWAVPKAVLEKALFPVGQMEKSEVRRLAKQFALPVAEKKDSQGICFLGSVSVKDFLRAELGNDEALLRTVGERVEGKRVAAKRGGKLVFGDVPALRTIPFHSANWFEDPGTVVAARYRYRGPRIAGRIDGSVFAAETELAEPVAEGQSLVLYARAGGKERVAGGGIIGAC